MNSIENNTKELIFRQKSIDRISSPEQLHDYIKVSSPGAWIILVAIIIFLVGELIWGVKGSITINTEQGTRIIAPIELLFER